MERVKKRELRVQAELCADRLEEFDGRAAMMGGRDRARDPKRAKRVMAAMMKMKKIVIADLEKAYDGRV